MRMVKFAFALATRKWSSSLELWGCHEAAQPELEVDLCIQSQNLSCRPTHQVTNRQYQQSSPEEQENTKAGERSMNIRVEDVSPDANLNKQTQDHSEGGRRA